MPILLKKIDKRKKKGKDCSVKQTRTDDIWQRGRDEGCLHCPAEKEKKGIYKKYLSKPLKKITNYVKKRKDKFCKKSKHVGKICICKVDTIERFLVLRGLLKDVTWNSNHSALAADLTQTFRPCLRSSSCTAIKDIACTDLSTYRINKCIADLQKYSKYVPVCEMWGPIYPGSYAHDCERVWLDMQVWYSRYWEVKAKVKTKGDLNKSKSESSLTDSPKKKLSVAFEDKSTDVNARNKQREERHKKTLLAQRFHLDANAQYITIVCCQHLCAHLECRLQLYVLRVSADEDDMVLLKMDLLVKCFRGFVQSDGEYEMHWVDDIKEVLPAQMDLMACGSLNPEVALELAFQLNRAKAVLYVSRTASTLLRHQGICFLDTLAMTAGVSRKELIVLPLDLNPSEMTSSESRRQSEENLPKRKDVQAEALF